MMGLRETLEAATPGEWTVHGPEHDQGVEYWHVYSEGHDLEVMYQTPADARLIALAPKLAARNLEAAERLRDVREFYGHLMGKDELADHDALLARLDQIGVADETEGSVTVPARRPEDDALDRLVRAALNSVPAVDPAVIDELRSTVREALERLRSVKAIAQIKELLERAESAEAEARTNFFNMEAERQGREHFENEANALRIENRRLTEGLRETADSDLTMPGIIRRKARSLLSANPPQGDAAAGSSPSDGGTGENLAARVQEAKRILATGDQTEAIAFLLDRTVEDVRGVIEPDGGGA